MTGIELLHSAEWIILSVDCRDVYTASKKACFVLYVYRESRVARENEKVPDMPLPHPLQPAGDTR